MKPAEAAPSLPAWLAPLRGSPSGARALGLAAQVRSAVLRGALLPGDRLPPTRAVAQGLNLSRGTVVSAWDLLCAEGLLSARAGSGTFVSSDAVPGSGPATEAEQQWIPPRVQPPAPAVDAPLLGAIDFRPCRPALEHFPRKEWRRCVAWAAGGALCADYGDPRGEPELRAAIADYLRRARGLTFGADNILVTNGAVQAMHIVAQVYLAADERGRVPVAVMEDPGFPLARQVLLGAGAEVHCCEVDEDGLIVEQLPAQRHDVRLVYVTPSHQFPTGSRLSLGRRHALVQWARARGVLIVEDDYDGEFRYDVQPLAPLALDGGGCVVYCGSFSKTLFPGLRMGFAAAHPAQIQALADFRVHTDYTCNPLLQRALARFIEEGLYERHIHRMRRIYARKRGVLAQALEQLPVPLRLTGLDSGLNGLARLQGEAGVRFSVAQLALQARQRGVLMPTLDQYSQGQLAENGLVLGYAALTDAEIQRGIQALA